MGRKYRRTGRFRRLQRIKKRLSKRLSRLRRGGRKRVYVASADPDDARLDRLAEALADLEPDAEEPGPVDAAEVEDDVEAMESDSELAVAGMAHAYGLVAILADSHIRTLQALMANLPPEELAAAEAAIEALEDAKNDAEAVLDVVGDPEEDDDDDDADDLDESQTLVDPLAAEFLGKYGIVGMGLTGDSGGPTRIEVRSSEPEAARAALPTKYAGFPVDVVYGQTPVALAGRG